jgi:D-alanine-D-alanine ligase
MTQLNTNVDVKALGKVAVLMGGSSAEREVSLMSGTGVLQALRSRGVDAHAFDPSETDLIELKRGGYARCFIALHGRHGEDGTVQGALELLGIPYTGPGVMASSIAIDKIMTKRIWRFEGLSTPDWRLVSSAAETEQALQALGAPMIVKPSREGSTIGLTKVTSPEQCAKAYALASQYDPEVLCEQFIEGDETTCPVLGEGAAAQALPGEVLISSRKGWRSLARIMMSARAQPRQPRARKAFSTRRWMAASSCAGKPLGQWYWVVSVKYLFW